MALHFGFYTCNCSGFVIVMIKDIKPQKNPVDKNIQPDKNNPYAFREKATFKIQQFKKQSNRGIQEHRSRNAENHPVHFKISQGYSPYNSIKF
jgi:hypothetical protein